MTGVWLNSFIKLMWKVLLWHCHNKASVYFNAIINIISNLDIFPLISVSDTVSTNKPIVQWSSHCPATLHYKQISDSSIVFIKKVIVSIHKAVIILQSGITYIYFIQMSLQISSDLLPYFISLLFWQRIICDMTSVCL